MNKDGKQWINPSLGAERTVLEIRIVEVQSLMPYLISELGADSYIVDTLNQYVEVLRARKGLLEDQMLAMIQR